MIKHSETDGRLDVSGWDGAEDTDPRMDLSRLDASRPGPMSFAIVCDGPEHPDRRVAYAVANENVEELVEVVA